MNQEIKFIIVDLFCGAGGTTTGFEKASLTDPSIKIAKVVACVNHDPLAIKSHWENHQEIEHFEEDITLLYGFVKNGIHFRSPQILRLIRLIDLYRACYPNAKVILWASLECTNFSKAKGGKARDADSRTLAEHLHPYIFALDPDYIQIENVVEFMSWGPLDENGKPISRRNGNDWLKWRNAICSHGYTDEWKEINSADFGALTSRNRLFGCFTRNGLTMAWPMPTHAKNPEKTSMYAPLKKWEAVRKALDFTDEGNSVFNRKKALSTKTMQRLFMGCIKHIAGGKNNFLTQSSNGWSKVYSTDQPSRVITTKDNQHLIKACFIDQRNGGNPDSKSISIEDPARTLTSTGGNQQIVQASFIAKHYSGKPEYKSSSIEDPLSTITTKDHNAVVNAIFITKWNSNDKKNGGHPGHSVDEPSPVVSTQNRLGVAVISKYNGVNGGKHDNSNSIDGPLGTLTTGGQHNSIEEPAASLTTKDRLSKVSAPFIDQQFSQGKQNQSVDDPLGAITTVPKSKIIQAYFFIDKQYGGEANHQVIDQPAGTILKNDKHSLIRADKWLMNTNYENVGSSMEEPAPTLTASRRHHYIINPSWGGHSGSIEEPCHVVIARQDKAPLYLITCKHGPVLVPVYEDDCEWTIKLKEFMAIYGISDIKMRMLKVPELKSIQGFPPHYILLGNQSDQKKFIGNAVHPYVPEKWIIAMALKVFDNQLQAA